ncbi:MAG: potassium transporter TrkG [Butyricicoccaceae bacterium]
MGTPDDPFCSLVHYAEDPLVSLTIMALIVLGGLGFFVWSDVWDHRRFRSLSLHSKLVLAMSGVLLGGGFLPTLLFEWSNPATLGGMTLPHKLLAAAFQSVTLRTAGFTTIDECADRPRRRSRACSC